MATVADLCALDLARAWPGSPGSSLKHPENPPAAFLGALAFFQLEQDTGHSLVKAGDRMGLGR